MFYMIREKRCGSSGLEFSGCRMVIGIQSFLMAYLPKGRGRILLRGCVMGIECGKRKRRYFWLS